MKPIMDDNFMFLKCTRIARTRLSSKICLENSFEQKQRLAKEFVDKTP
jgi:hypothetical protein